MITWCICKASSLVLTGTSNHHTHMLCTQSHTYIIHLYIHFKFVLFITDGSGREVKGPLLCLCYFSSLKGSFHSFIFPCRNNLHFFTHTFSSNSKLFIPVLIAYGHITATKILFVTKPPRFSKLFVCIFINVFGFFFVCLSLTNFI